MRLKGTAAKADHPMKEASAVMIHKSTRGTAQAGSPATSTVADRPQDALDMSMDSVPSDWLQAQNESLIPYADYARLTKHARFDVIPNRSGDGTFIAVIAALGASLFAGGAWCLAEVFGLYSGPWGAVAVGALIALAVRFAGGAASVFRAVLSLAFYLVTLVVVMVVLTHQDLNQIYGSGGNFDAYESTIVRTRLQDSVHLIAYILGGLVAAQLGFISRLRR